MPPAWEAICSVLGRVNAEKAYQIETREYPRGNAPRGSRVLYLRFVGAAGMQNTVVFQFQKVKLISVLKIQFLKCRRSAHCFQRSRPTVSIPSTFTANFDPVLFPTCTRVAVTPVALRAAPGRATQNCRAVVVTLPRQTVGR